MRTIRQRISAQVERETCVVSVDEARRNHTNFPFPL